MMLVVVVVVVLLLLLVVRLLVILLLGLETGCVDIERAAAATGVGRPRMLLIRGAGGTVMGFHVSINAKYPTRALCI